MTSVFVNVLNPTKSGFFSPSLLGYAFTESSWAAIFFFGVIDFSGITNSLINGEGVTRENFVYVALYISFVNSFCEELIFRGLAFGALGGVVSRRISYPFSALTFAVYHVAIMTGWFSPLIFVLMIVGLAVGGMIFNRIDDGADSIYPSWIIHLFANLGINTVGLILFGII